jgi:hypothetical protein
MSKHMVLSSSYIKRVLVIVFLAMVWDKVKVLFVIFWLWMHFIWEFGPKLAPKGYQDCYLLSVT